MLPLLLAGLAVAAPNEGGVAILRDPDLTLRVAPDAEVELLPPARPGLAEILVRGSDVDLASQLTHLRVRGVRAARASDLGAAWLVVVALADERSHLVVHHHGPVVVAEVAPGPVELDLPVHPAPTLAALFDGSAEIPTCASGPLPLSPLTGRDASVGLDASEHLPELPRWTRAEPSEASWDEVAAWRARTWSARTAKESAYTWYRLGALYRDLGHAREAAWYFGVAQESGGGGWQIPLQRAGARLSVGRWDEAVTAAEAAWRLGAPDESVLEVLAVAALAGADLPAAPTARALAAATGRGAPLLLAGAILLREECPAEAAPVLARAVPRLDAEHEAKARLMLADAHLGAGSVKEAAMALAGVPVTGLDGELSGLLRVRNRLLSMLRGSPSEWSQFVPALELAGRGWDLEAREALHLVAQVHVALGDDRPAVEAWSNLLLRHHLPVESGPGRRLVEAWTGRLRRLTDAGQTVDALSLHQAIWRPELLQLMRDPEPLRRVAEGYGEVGLPDRALAVYQSVWAVEGRDGLDDRGTTLALAELYARLGRTDEAQETIRFLARSRTLEPDQKGRVALVEADLAQASGDRDGALAAWLRAEAVPATRDEGRARRVLFLAGEGRCAEVTEQLREVVQAPAWRTPVNQAVLARCLELAGDREGAGLQARQAAAGASDPGFRSWIGFVADRLGGPADTTGATGGQVWDRVRTEDETHSAWEAKVDGRLPGTRGGSDR